MLLLVTAPCVSETSPPVPLAEPSVYLPSRERHQQPSPKEVRQCGLPSSGLPARVAKPTQKSKQMILLDPSALSFVHCLTPASSIVPQPSTSSVTSDEKVDYVQVDKEKTQALQSTMQEWTDVRQSTEPAKGVKS